MLIILTLIFFLFFAGCAFLTYVPESTINAQNLLHDKQTLSGVSVTSFHLFFMINFFFAIFLMALLYNFTLCEFNDDELGKLLGKLPKKYWQKFQLNVVEI